METAGRLVVENASTPKEAVQGASRTFASHLRDILGGQFACAAVALVTQVLYARLLGPVGRGQVGLCLMAIALGVLVGGLGGEVPLVIWTAHSREKASEWLAGIFLLGFAGSVASCCLWAAIYWIWHPAFLQGITSPMAAVVLATIPPSILLTYLMTILRGLERFRLRSGLALANQAMGLAAVVALVLLFNRTPEMAVFANLVTICVGTSLSVFFLRDFLGSGWQRRGAGNNIGSALSLGVRGQLGNLASFFNYRLDVFVVNYFLGPAQVGIYAVGVIVSEALWQIPQAAAVALGPRTVRTIDKGATEFTCLVLHQVLVVACISSAIMAICCPLAMRVVFGDHFSASVEVIWWLLPGVIALSLAKVTASDLVARGKPEFSSVFSSIALLVTVVLDLTLIPRMGINGAALASSAAYIVNAALLAGALKRELKVSWKTLLVPTRFEFVPYRLAWLRCRAWVESKVSSPAALE